MLYSLTRVCRWIVAFSLVLLLCLASPRSSLAAPQAGKVWLELVGAIGPGPVRAVAVSGSYAYIGSGAVFQVADVSNPAAPRPVAWLRLPDVVRDIEVTENIAYMAAEDGGLRMVDVSDPAAPREVGFVNTPGKAMAVAVVGNTACVADLNGSLRVVDVSDPSAPQEVGFRDTPDSAHDVAVVGNTAYLAAGNGGLRVIDVSDPSAPREVGSLPVAKTKTGWGAYHVTVAGNKAYVMDQWSGYNIVDVSDPSAPQEVGSLPWMESNSIAAAGNTAYVAAGDGGLRVVDVSDPSASREVGSLNIPGESLDVVVSKNTAYVAAGRGGLRVVDVSDPSAPREVGSMDMPDYASGVAVAGNTAYVTARDGGLRMVDVSDPSAPREVGFLDTPGEANSVAAVGTTAYLADGKGGLRVVDVGTPAAPREMGFLDTPSGANGVAVVGNMDCVAGRGLRLVDVSDPSAPREVGFLNTPGLGRYVAVAGNTAYVAAEVMGLRVVDISDPAAPREVGFLDTPGLASGVAMAGSIAYVADRYGGLRVVDVSDPLAPWEVTFVDTPGDASGVAVVGNMAYVAAEGLLIYRIHGLSPEGPGPGQWFTGIIHAHSTFSDGMRNPEALVEQARKAGAQFLMVTDHYEAIPSRDWRKKAGEKFADDFGFDKYHQRFDALSRDGEFVVIPGAEITSFWGPENASSASHTLALGRFNANDPTLDQLSPRIDQIKANQPRGNQAQIIRRLNELGMLPVAAHPHLVETVDTSEAMNRWSFFWWDLYTQVKTFQYNILRAEGLKGMELFNAKADQAEQDFLWYLQEVTGGNKLFVTGGCDSHFPEPWDPEDGDRWLAKTHVFADQLTEKSLLDALRAGRTVASKYVSSVDLTPVPAFQPQEVDRPEFRLKVTYVRPSTAPKTVELYRDGKKVEEATQEFPAGRTELVYQWHDTTAAKGEHTYILRIPVVLTMSPIVLNVIGEVEPAVSDPARIADFDTFLRRFQQALAEKDKDTIRRMMSADFFDVHGAETPEGFLELLGDLYSWEDMSQVAAGKREVGGDEQGEHIITRKGGAMLFRKVNGFWRFAMWMSGD